MMKAAQWLAVTLGIGLAGVVDGWAGSNIEGKVDLSHRPKERAPTARYKLKSGQVGKPAPWVAVVYLEGDFPNVSVDAPEVEVEQRQFQFTPRVIAVQKGAKVRFPNRDDDYHNVLSYSRAKEFDLGRYRKDEEPPPLVFDHAGVVELDCEIHAHMRATIVVLDTPYFTTTDPEGNFRLEGLPPGKHTLKVLLDSRTTLARPVELREGETLAIELGPQ